MIKFTHPNLVGKDCYIESSFSGPLTELCDIAKKYGLKLYCNSSFRDSIIVPGAIVHPAKMSNHLVGHAIDANIVDGTVFWNSGKMEKGLSGNVLLFIEEVRKHPHLRWGGDFKTDRDVVHYDDGLEERDPNKYIEIIKTLEKKAC